MADREENMTERDNNDGFASADAGRTVIGSWQEDLGGMDTHPVPPTPSPAQPSVPSQQGQPQWNQPMPTGQPMMTANPVNQSAPQMPNGIPMQQGQGPQAGQPYQPSSQGMGQAGQMQMVQQPQKASKAPLIIFLLILVAIGTVVFVLTRQPDEPDVNVIDGWSDVTGTDTGGNTDKGHDADDDGTDGTVSAKDSLSEDITTDDKDDGTDGTVTDSVMTDATEAPTAEDFQWAGASWIKEGHVPERATKLTDLESLIGSWKGYIRYEPATAGDELVEEFLNVTAGREHTSTTFRFDWGYIVVRNGASRYDNAAEDSEFLGTWDGENGAIYATCDSGNLEMKRFWYEDGQQYAYGTLTLPDGAVGDVYLTRS